MSCRVLESCWNALRRLAKAVKGYKQPIDFCSLCLDAEGQAVINQDIESPEGTSLAHLLVNPEFSPANLPQLPQAACFRLEGSIHMVELQAGRLPEEARTMIRTYAPYCFAAMHARRLQRAFVISHFAQTLDGRIASCSGESKWIGGQANLIHAHRMRALCDGVLVGSRTFKQDHPRLTVRHVQGRNPLRIVLGDSVEEVASLTDASSDPVLLIGQQRRRVQEGVQVLTLERKNGYISSAQILQKLFQQQAHSLYLEGGARTTSCFLQEDALDIVQLHFSPMILGDGLTGFTVPQIQNIGDSIRFASHQYLPVGDGIMFVGALKPESARSRE